MKTPTTKAEAQQMIDAAERREALNSYRGSAAADARAAEARAEVARLKALLPSLP